jgi:hypothetical protein
MKHLARLAVAALVAALVLAGCGSSPGAPLSTLMSAGHPSIDSSSHAVRPGKFGYATAFVVNSQHAKVTLVSATLVPLHGQPAGQLAHVAVYLNHDITTGGAGGWPPSGPNAGLDIAPLRGAKIGHGQTDILYAMTAPADPDSYTMAAGIRVTYRWDGTTYKVTAWSALANCGDKISFNRCGALENRALNLTERQAG